MIPARVPARPGTERARYVKPHLPCKQGMATSVALQPQLTAYGGSFYECPPHQLRGEGTATALAVAAAAATTTIPAPRPTHDAAASWSVYRPRALRALVYAPLRPGCAGPSLSRCHRALHGPCYILPTVGHVPRQALPGRQRPPSSTRQRASCARRFAARPIPVPTPASAAGTQAAKRCR